jgi:hypothetical protein
MQKAPKTEPQKELEDDLANLMSLRDDAYLCKQSENGYNMENEIHFLQYFKTFVKKWGKS